MGYGFRLEVPMLDQDSAYKAGLIVLRELQNVLTGVRSGRWYPLPGNIKYDKATPAEGRAKNYHVKFIGAASRGEIEGAAYQASAPGEPPAVRTGVLRNSFFLTVEKAKRGFVAVIKTTVTYANDLESGTERVRPRPFIEPALQKALPEIRKLHGRAVYKIIRESV